VLNLSKDLIANPYYYLKNNPILYDYVNRPNFNPSKKFKKFPQILKIIVRVQV